MEKVVKETAKVATEIGTEIASGPVVTTTAAALVTCAANALRLASAAVAEETTTKRARTIGTAAAESEETSTTGPPARTGAPAVAPMDGTAALAAILTAVVTVTVTESATERGTAPAIATLRKIGSTKTTSMWMWSLHHAAVPMKTPCLMTRESMADTTVAPPRVISVLAVRRRPRSRAMLLRAVCSTLPTTGQ